MIAAIFAIATHVLTWAYWGQPGEDQRVDASWMQQHVDYLETNGDLGKKFREAGGHYVIAYTDPVKVIPARHEDLWNLPEEAWFHNASGGRVARRYESWGVQNILNPASQRARYGFAALTQHFLDDPPHVFTHVLVDDLSWDLRNVFYEADSSGVEITSDDDYDAAAISLLRASSLPVFFNGLGDTDGHQHDVSGDIVFLPFVQGGMHEGCFFNANGPRSDDSWRFDANTLLYTTQHHKQAVCLDNTSLPSSVPARSYYLPSWWLTYDPLLSITFADLPSPGKINVFPEYSIIPTYPLQTAKSNVDELLQDGGAYGRQFRVCYQNGTPIGPCAAIVNPSSSHTVFAPYWAKSYHAALRFEDKNTFEGGRVRWDRTTTPKQLAPHQAFILVRK